MLPLEVILNEIPLVLGTSGGISNPGAMVTLKRWWRVLSLGKKFGVLGG
jgi:hypothetical protein